MDTLTAFLDHLNGLAGLAAIVNGLLLWPIVKALKANDERHDADIREIKARLG